MSRRYNWAVILGDMQDRLFMSQEELADTLHISQQSVSAYMHGRRYPSPQTEKTLLAFAAKHNIKVNSEYAGTELMQLQKLLLTSEAFARLVRLYDKMTGANRKKLVRYAEKLCL